MTERHHRALWADRVDFEVSGRGARAFLSRAAQPGVHLWTVRCAAEGYTGRAAGTDIPRLRQAARMTGAELRLKDRRGPGRFLERAAARPGLLAGLAVFFIMNWYFGGFLWSVDFGDMESARQEVFRSALAEEGIREGCRINEEILRRAEQTLETKLTDTGWVSLNFTSGCLSVEETQRQTETVQENGEPRALYAKAAGEVLAVKLQSGFAQVVPGQYVSQGQLLANGQKADREGEAVVQGASGTVWGRMEKVYTAAQPLQREAIIFTGDCRTETSWQLLGYTWQDAAEDSSGEEEAATEWIPLRLGRIALPGSLCRTTYWKKDSRTLAYSDTTARDLAARSCRLQLLQEFPDTQLEEQTLSFAEKDGQMTCTAEYVFCADMTQPGDLAPLETEGTTG